MSNHCFPSFNFPFTSSVDLQQSVCDYGRTGSIAVFKDEKRNIRCLPQKKAVSLNTAVRLHAEKPSLPIKLPNKTCRRYNFDESIGQYQSNIDDVCFNFTQRNITNFSADHSDVLYNSLSHSVSSAIIGYPQGRRQSRQTRRRHLNKKLGTLANRVGDEFGDLPIAMLEDLLEESFSESMNECNGAPYGNCLEYQAEENGDIILASPGGLYMNKLMLTHLEFLSDGMVMKMKQEHEVCTFPGQIFQISTRHEDFDKQLIALRTDYKCSLFHFDHNQEQECQRPNIKVLGNLACKTRPCSVLVNPYIPGEVVVAMETGSIYLWQEKNSFLEVVKQCSASTAGEFDWYFCEFGSHPRQIIRGSKTSVELLDLRASSSAGKELMTLPSPHFFNGDQFSAIQRHPGNPYHYFLGTNQFLVIMDERFQQNPILKWCHSLAGSIKYINVVPDALPGTSDVLVFVGEHKNHEVHCYQYCYGEDAPKALKVAGTMGGLPPQATANPWKISPCNDWPNKIDLPNKLGILPFLSKKLSAPLLGLTCIPFEKNLSVLQLSKEGDIFYQMFEPKVEILKQHREDGQVYFYEEMDTDHTVSGGGKTLVLSQCDHELVENWFKFFKQDSNKANLSALKGTNSGHIDVEVLRSLSNLEYDSQCQLCKCCSTEETTDQNEEFVTCFYCGLDRVISCKITDVCTYKESVVLTNGYLGVTHKFKGFNVFDENEEYCDPLGIALLRNWNSDEPQPVNFGENKTQNDISSVENKVPPPEMNHEAINVDLQNMLESAIRVNDISTNEVPKIGDPEKREVGESHRGLDIFAQTLQRESSVTKKPKLGDFVTM